MFTTSSENRDFAIKPMNCRRHPDLNHGLKSYRDLPLRLAEFGSCHRNEPSGTLHGLMRVRNFVQDDAHIFCSEDQILDEVSALSTCCSRYTATSASPRCWSSCPRAPRSASANDALWDKPRSPWPTPSTRRALPSICSPARAPSTDPRFEFSLRDCLDRVWQCGTIQLDFSMPDRLGASYVAEDNTRKVPVMLHRAILGSLERFIGILIEHHAGQMPPWLAPLQAVVLNITDRQAEAVERTANSFVIRIRVETDLRNEKIGFKIREHTLQRIPYLLVVGDRKRKAARWPYARGAARISG